MCRSTIIYVYVYVLHVTDVVAMQTSATMYIVNFVNKLQNSEEKGLVSPISTILITDRYIWYVCVCLQLSSKQTATLG